MLTSVKEKLIFHTGEKKMSFQELANVEVRNRDDYLSNLLNNASKSVFKVKNTIFTKVSNFGHPVFRQPGSERLN